MKKVILLLILLAGCSAPHLIDKLISSPERYSGQTVILNGVPAMHTVSCGNAGLCTYEYYLVKDEQAAKDISLFDAKLKGVGIQLARQGQTLSCTDQQISKDSFKNCNHNKVVDLIVGVKQQVRGDIIQLKGKYYFELP